MKSARVKIEDISYEGAGVGRFDGKVVFVPKTLIGEVVDVDIIKETASFCIGEMKNLIEKSERRIESFCPYFDKCGGCDFQHCNYEGEKEIKLQLVKEEFSKIGYVDGFEFVEAKSRNDYRNKIKLEVEGNKIGYFKDKSHQFFEIEKCPIATKDINLILPKIREFLKENNFKNLKNIYIKNVDKKLGICFLFSKNNEKAIKNIKKINIFDKNSVFFAFGDILESDKTKIHCVFGEEKLKKKLFENHIQIEMEAFNQVNDEMAERLYNEILNFVENKRVINAYSGQGLLTYLIAQKAKFVYGIECQKSAHEAAEKLKKLIFDYKIENICGKVEENIQKIILRDKIDVVVLDPARKGCQKEVLEAILQSEIEDVVYISCKYSTQVRDLRILKEKYEIKNVKIFDMFPSTSNAETAVFLRKKS